ncbi:hypothetical protein Dda_3144 [Drechslerella dactyloides]|uniref:Uncharacterized protein n=1 Tax=Drechslerella dactyloides TaxID=74499 RepID=A0AAD6J217_DREDA|nr:hypothetical protein Dda_3144 [Drechslerella dactyloides]
MQSHLLQKTRCRQHPTASSRRRPGQPANHETAVAAARRTHFEVRRTTLLLHRPSLCISVTTTAMSDWAPYQSTDPEAQRSSLRSPPPGSSFFGGSSSPPPPQSHVHNPWGDSRSYSPSNVIQPESNAVASGSNAGAGAGAVTGFGSNREFVNQFETSLPIRLDVEAALAYILLPPAGGVLLLLLEHNSDYVRFHAWQSALLFTGMFILHIIFSWSGFFSWLLFFGDLSLIVYLSVRAYSDADTLDRFEIPYVGAWASSFVDEE